MKQVDEQVFRAPDAAALSLERRKLQWHLGE
jgi:hypothetical protein